MYRSMHGRGVGRVELLFELMSPYSLFKSYFFIFITELKVLYGGNAVASGRLIIFEEYPPCDYKKENLQVYRRILTPEVLLKQAHMVPSKGDRWILNAHADLTVYNEIY